MFSLPHMLPVKQDPPACKMFVSLSHKKYAKSWEVYTTEETLCIMSNTLTAQNWTQLLPFASGGAAGGGSSTSTLCAHLSPHQGEPLGGHALPGEERRASSAL